MTKPEKTDDRHRGRRRKRWIRPDLQGKVVLAAVVVAQLTLLVHFQLSFAFIWLGRRPELLDAVRHEETRLLVTATLASCAVAIPVAFLVGKYLSFKFCGPIFRFKQYLQGLVDDRWDRRCELRSGDELQDLKEVINSTVGSFADQMNRSRKLLGELRDVVERDGDAVTDRQALEDLLERARAEEALLGHRLGDTPTDERPDADSDDDATRDPAPERDAAGGRPDELELQS